MKPIATTYFKGRDYHRHMYEGGHIRNCFRKHKSDNEVYKFLILAVLTTIVVVCAFYAIRPAPYLYQ